MQDIKKIETMRFADVIGELSNEEHDFVLGMVYSSFLRQERHKDEEIINCTGSSSK